MFQLIRNRKLQVLEVFWDSGQYMVQACVYSCPQYLLCCWLRWIRWKYNQVFRKLKVLYKFYVCYYFCRDTSNRSSDRGNKKNLVSRCKSCPRFVCCAVIHVHFCHFDIVAELEYTSLTQFVHCRTKTQLQQHMHKHRLHATYINTSSPTHFHLYFNSHFSASSSCFSLHTHPGKAAQVCFYGPYVLLWPKGQSQSRHKDTVYEICSSLTAVINIFAALCMPSPCSN